MKQVVGYPPNYQEIRRNFIAPPNTYYAFGDTIYNPDGNEIPEDVLFHEAIHSKQQKAFGVPELWWAKYIFDSSFRLSQEVEAYAGQLKFIRKHFSARATKEALEEMARNLSSPLYKLNISYPQAYTMIRKSVV